MTAVPRCLFLSKCGAKEAKAKDCLVFTELTDCWRFSVYLSIYLFIYPLPSSPTAVAVVVVNKACRGRSRMCKV